MVSTWNILYSSHKEEFIYDTFIQKIHKYDSKYGMIQICSSINILQLEDEYINVTFSNYFKND